MIFYIFGSNTETFKCSTSKALYATDDYSDAMSKMVKASKKSDYDYMYLVVDFGTQKPNFLCATKQKESGVDSIPFLIIAIYDIKSGLYSKDDTIVFESGGFRQEFKDNIKAIDKLIYFINNGIDFKSYIRYKTSKEGSIIKNISIANNKIKRFFINPNIWEPNPIERKKEFYNIIMS